MRQYWVDISEYWLNNLEKQGSEKEKQNADRKGISIPSILKVGKGALTKIGSYLKNEGIEQAVIFLEMV